MVHYSPFKNINCNPFKNDTWSGKIMSDIGVFLGRSPFVTNYNVNTI